jgi:hypothetical protein
MQCAAPNRITSRRTIRADAEGETRPLLAELGNRNKLMQGGWLLHGSWLIRFG